VPTGSEVGSVTDQSIAQFLQRFQSNFLALAKPWALAAPDHFGCTQLSSFRHLSQEFAASARKMSCWAKLGAGSGKAQPL
jgi:hypothetical protein